jgi:putative ABC transport system substrate-binding protein
LVPAIFFLANRGRVGERLARSGLPVVTAWREYTAAGSLLSYGPNVLELHRHAAGYVDRILKGAKPGDLAIEQPTSFELVINRKTAKALRLTIPPYVLARADEIIE